MRNSPKGLSFWFRVATLAWLAWYSVSFFTSTMMQLGEGSSFLHRPNLVFHEAGHVIFGFAGNRVLTALGGSLMQVLVPLGIMVAFLAKNRDAFAGAVFLWWAGQNLVDVAPYINDARMLQLPLLGGGTGREIEGHDWEFILTRVGWLDLDVRIARGVLLAGRAVMAAAWAWGAAVLAWDAWRGAQDAADAGEGTTAA